MKPVAKKPTAPRRAPRNEKAGTQTHRVRALRNEKADAQTHRVRAPRNEKADAQTHRVRALRNEKADAQSHRVRALRNEKADAQTSRVRAPRNEKTGTPTSRVRAPRNEKADAQTHRVRADAQRNIDALLEAAKIVFGASGVDATVREIAARAAVGLATVYRHFPQRSDLIAAVFRREVDACVAAAAQLKGGNTPVEALAKWLQRYTHFIATKRGLAAALHSGEPAFCALPVYFRQHLEPVVQSLLEAAENAGQIRHGVDAYDLLRAVGNLSVPDEAHTQRMVALLVDGLRYGAR